MIPYMFTVFFYAVGIFVNTTNNYQLTKSSPFQTKFILCQEHDIKFHNFSNVIHLIPKFGKQCKIKRRKKKKKLREENQGKKEKGRWGGRPRVHS